MIRSDGQLVRAVLAGDAWAYGELVTRYERAAKAVALRVLHDHHSAADAGQEGLVVGYQRLGSLREGDAFGPWLLKIVRREAQRLGARRRHAVGLEAVADRAASVPDDRAVLDEELLSAMARLPEYEHAVVLLRRFEGYSVQEIATLTVRPLGTVTKSLSRAHRRLRRWLGEEME